MCTNTKKRYFSSSIKKECQENEENLAEKAFWHLLLIFMRVKGFAKNQRLDHIVTELSVVLSPDIYVIKAIEHTFPGLETK